MIDSPNIVNMNDLEWEEAHYSGKVGKFESTDYWADEPDPPVVKVQE